MESGMLMKMMTVLRHEPRNSRIMLPVSRPASMASHATPLMAARTNRDWSTSGVISSCAGTVAKDACNASMRASDVQRAVATGLQDGEQGAALAIHVHHAGLRGKPVVHVGHVSQVDGGVPTLADGNVVQLLQHLWAAVGPDHVVHVAKAHIAGRQDDVLLVERHADIGGADAAGVQEVRVKVHHDLARLAATGQGDLRALHGGQARADEVQTKVVDSLLAQRVAAQRHLQDGHAAGAVPDDQRRRGAWRHDAQQRLVDGGDLRHRGFNLGARLEVHPDDGHSCQAGALDVLDAVDRGGHGALADGHHAAFHLFWADAAVVPDDADHRDVYFRKDVHRNAGQRKQPREGHREGCHHEGVRAPKSKFDNPHGFGLRDLRCKYTL